MRVNSTAVGVLIMGLLFASKTNFLQQTNSNEPENPVKKVLVANNNATILWQQNIPILSCRVNNKTLVVQTLGEGQKVPAFSGNLPPGFVFGLGSGATYIINDKGVASYLGTATDAALISNRLIAIGVATTGQHIDSKSSSGKVRFEVANLSDTNVAERCGF
jgi:hypothetical protein